MGWTNPQHFGLQAEQDVLVLDKPSDRETKKLMNWETVSVDSNYYPPEL